MPQIYITVAERYVRSLLPFGHFNIEHHHLYDELVTPRVVSTLLREYSADEARGLLEYVVQHVEDRRGKAKGHLNRYSLACYASWLRNAIAQIVAPSRAGRRKTEVDSDNS